MDPSWDIEIGGLMRSEDVESSITPWRIPMGRAIYVPYLLGCPGTEVRINGDRINGL